MTVFVTGVDGLCCILFLIVMIRVESLLVSGFETDASWFVEYYGLCTQDWRDS